VRGGWTIYSRIVGDVSGMPLNMPSELYSGPETSGQAAQKQFKYDAGNNKGGKN